MGTTWPCFNIDSQVEHSWKKIHVVYLVGSAWCRVLWVAQTERDHYWSSLHNWWDWVEHSRKKHAHYYSRHDKIILLHDNARPHTVAAPVKNYLETLKWEVLPHPPYSPDIAPSDYHLFRSMMACLSSTSHHEDTKNCRWLDSLKRWNVLPMRYPHATRKMGKSSG